MIILLQLAFLVCIGIIIGWNWPQPDWAQQAQNQVVGTVRKILVGSSNPPPGPGSQ